MAGKAPVGEIGPKGETMGLFARKDHKNVHAALSKSQAFIEFDLNGKILDANENFCTALGYRRDEIIGQHHRMFCEQAYAESAEYKQFWNDLAAGKFDAREYKRLGKGGKEIWIQASYNPVFSGGKPYKVVKIATDITEAKRRALEDANKISAISRSQAVIEFTPTGEILSANENFCQATGYALSEIVGRHHSMFCEPEYVASPAYKAFWDDLAQGRFLANEFVRYGKGGREVWIQATYNPIHDLSGKVYKVVKFATDVTPRMSAINALGEALTAVADGDLTQCLEQAFVPTMEKVRADFNAAIAKLRAAMQTVAGNAEGIASAAAEVREASDDLAKRTERQAAALEEAAAALEEITTTVADASQRADEAGRLVGETRRSAQSSGEIVEQAIEAMSRIEQSSGQITSIIGVIDDIAFQTNLLALNAGVEAARAGEAGKGFAVVAQEVRELAQRSAGAAKEIKTLIHTSGEQVSSGVSLVGKTGAALSEIVSRVGEIDLNVNAIMGAAREQAASLREISHSVNQMDQATQKNAAMVEETTAASHGLAREADSLHGLLREFRIDAAGHKRRIVAAA